MALSDTPPGSVAYSGPFSFGDPAFVRWTTPRCARYTAALLSIMGRGVAKNIVLTDCRIQAVTLRQSVCF